MRYIQSNNSYLTYSHLTNSDLTNSHLTNSHLTNSDLTNSDLTNSDLTNSREIERVGGRERDLPALLYGLVRLTHELVKWLLVKCLSVKCLLTKMRRSRIFTTSRAKQKMGNCVTAFCADILWGYRMGSVCVCEFG